MRIFRLSLTTFFLDQFSANLFFLGKGDSCLRPVLQQYVDFVEQRSYGIVFFGGDQFEVRLGSSTLAKQTPETYHETDP